MSASWAAPLREPAVAIARRAGEAILSVYRSEFAVQHKDDRSPLTEADLAAHRVIVDGLGALRPMLPVLSEEAASVPFAERSTWERYWLVDPLDGTREFVKRNGEFTVNIALIERGEPVLGVVYAPDRGYLTHALRGAGAFLERDGAAPVPMRTTRRGAIARIAGSRSHRDERFDAFAARLGDYELLALGSSLKFCLIAEGGADAYLRTGPTSEWDTAAGQCVLEEAGGRVTTLDGRPLRYNEKDSLLNPDFLAVGSDPDAWLALLRDGSGER
jgi:3'(2'), 5'-bisphosphate nucleotidase